MQKNSWPTWLKNAIVSGLVVALISPLVESSLSYAGVSFGWLTTLSKLVVNFLTYEIPVWQILTCIVALFAALAIWANTSTPVNPDWINYTSDRIEGVDWRWRWNGKKVTNLVPFCPECSAQLKVEPEPSFPIPGETRRYECPNCDFDGRWSPDILDNVRLIIERNAREGDYEV